jgi:hypothetical protein
MKNSDATLVLNVDDDKDSRKLIERVLTVPVIVCCRRTAVPARFRF